MPCLPKLTVRSRGVAQPGSALGLGPRGRRFESSRPDQLACEQHHSRDDCSLCAVFTVFRNGTRPEVVEESKAAKLEECRK